MLASTDGRAPAQPIFGLSLIGFTARLLASGRLQLPQTSEQMRNLVRHLLFDHLFRRYPQDGAQPGKKTRIMIPSGVPTPAATWRG